VTLVWSGSLSRQVGLVMRERDGRMKMKGEGEGGDTSTERVMGRERETVRNHNQ
jgi:hypothetical protein